MEVCGMGPATDEVAAGVGRPQKEGNEHLPPPSLKEEASIGCGRKITGQGHFLQRLA